MIVRADFKGFDRYSVKPDRFKEGSFVHFYNHPFPFLVSVVVLTKSPEPFKGPKVFWFSTAKVNRFGRLSITLVDWHPAGVEEEVVRASIHLEVSRKSHDFVITSFSERANAFLLGLSISCPELRQVVKFWRPENEGEGQAQA